jgi:hypothetical protein
MSSPVTIFPTVRRAGMSTEGDGCLKQEAYAVLGIKTYNWKQDNTQTSTKHDILTGGAE